MNVLCITPVDTVRGSFTCRCGWVCSGHWWLPAYLHQHRRLLCLFLQYWILPALKWAWLHRSVQQISSFCTLDCIVVLREHERDVRKLTKKVSKHCMYVHALLCVSPSTATVNLSSLLWASFPPSNFLSTVRTRPFKQAKDPLKLL